MLASKPHEFQHRAEPETVPERRDADAVLGEQHRVRRGLRRARHRERVAFAGFERQCRPEGRCQSRTPGTGGDHVLVRADCAAIRFHADHRARPGAHAGQASVLLEPDAAVSQRRRPLPHQHVGPNRCVPLVVERAREASSQRRVERRQLVALQGGVAATPNSSRSIASMAANASIPLRVRST